MTNTAITTTSEDPAIAKDPTVQRYSCCSFSGSAIRDISVVKALNMYMMAIPAMIIVVGEPFRSFDRMMITNMGISENTNALMTVVYCAGTPKIDIPSTMPMVAPKLAPDDTPVV